MKSLSRASLHLTLVFAMVLSQVAEASRANPKVIQIVIPPGQGDNTHQMVVTVSTADIPHLLDKLPPKEREVAMGFINPHKSGIIPEGYLKLLFGMGLSEGFNALISRDPYRVRDWWQSMYSWDFHLQMAVFEGAMKVSNLGFARMAGSNAELLSYLNHLVLPMGDLISNYFAEIYSHPRMQAIFKTYDPHVAVLDPDDKSPDPKPTLDPKVKLKVRRLLRVHLALDILADINKPNSLFGLFYHAFQLGMVSYMYQGIQHTVSTFLRREVTENGTYRVTGDFSQFSEFSMLLDNVGMTQKSFRLVESIRLAKLVAFAEEYPWLLRLGKFGGGVVGTAIFFALDYAVTSVIVPAVKHTQAINGVHERENDLRDTISWYLDPKRTEVVPASAYQNDFKKSMWLKFFLAGGDYNLKMFIENKGYWHDHIDQGWTTLWEQAYNFMREYSTNVLNKKVDEASFHECEGRGSHSMSVPCWMEWDWKNTPLFVKNLKAYQAEDFVQARLEQVSQAYTTYRNTVILAPIAETWQRWSKDIDTEAVARDRKDMYFQWIIRGMKLDDPFFVDNDSFWHPYVDDTALVKEEAQMVSDFDNEVLKMKNSYHPYVHCAVRTLLSGGAPTSGAIAGTCLTDDMMSAFSVHKANMEKFAKENRETLDYESFRPLVEFLYPDVFREADPKSLKGMDPEVVSVANKLLTNFVEWKPDAEALRLAGEDKFALRHFVIRWIWNGFFPTDEFKKNEGGWHPDGEPLSGFLDNYLYTFFVSPFFNLKDKSPQNLQFLKSVAQDIYNIFKTNNEPVSAEGRVPLLLLTKTFAEINRAHKAMTLELQKKNAKYLSLLNDLNHDRGRWAGHLWAKWRGTLDQGETLFNRGGMDSKNFVSDPTEIPDGDFHDAGVMLFHENPNSLPTGVINTFNWELNVYLGALQGLLKDFHPQVSNDFPRLMDEPSPKIGTFLDAIFNYNDGEFTPQEGPALFKSIQLAFNMVGMNTVTATDSRLRQLSALRLLQFVKLAAKAHFDATEAWNLSSMPKTAQNTLALKTQLAQYSKNQVHEIISALTQHGTAQVSGEDEKRLREALSNGHFGIPLMALSSTQAGGESNLMALILSRIIRSENQKLMQARINCYLINDPLCSNQ